MKRIYFFCSLLLSLLLTSCGDYDDSAIQNKLNDFKERITALQTKANKLNEDISKLSYLTEGNVITSVTRNSDGQYVITYKDSNNEEKAVVVATQEDVIEAPILGVRLSDDDQLYYWTTTIDNETNWLTDDAGKKVPVCGYTPEMGVNADGYWTVKSLKIAKALLLQLPPTRLPFLRVYPKLTMDISISHWATEKPLHWKYSIH